MIDLSWRAIALEALGGAWPVMAAFAGGQALVFRRTRRRSDLRIVLLVAVSIVASWVVAALLHVAPLGAPLAGFVVRHPWVIGVPACVFGFGATSIAWLASGRFVTGSHVSRSA